VTKDPPPSNRMAVSNLGLQPWQIWIFPSCSDTITGKIAANPGASQGFCSLIEWERHGGGGLPLPNSRIPGICGRIRILRYSGQQNPRLGHIDGLLGAEIFRIGMVFRVSHHISISDPIYNPYLQI